MELKTFFGLAITLTFQSVARDGPHADLQRFFETPVIVNDFSVFHQFRQAKCAYGGSIFSSNQFALLSQLP